MGRAWCFTTETFVATYKAIVCAILNYAAPIWFTEVSSSHLDKLELIQIKALRIATGCHQKATVSHLRAETGVLPLRAYLELCCQQFYASALQPLHPSHLIVTSPPNPCPLRGTIRPHTTALSEACELEVTTLTPPPPSSSGAHTPWPDDSS